MPRFQDLPRCGHIAGRKGRVKDLQGDFVRASPRNGEHLLFDFSFWSSTTWAHGTEAGKCIQDSCAGRRNGFDDELSSSRGGDKTIS